MFDIQLLKQNWQQYQANYAYATMAFITFVLLWQLSTITSRFSIEPINIHHHQAQHQHPLPDLSKSHLFGQYHKNIAIEKSQLYQLTGIYEADNENEHAYIIINTPGEKHIFHAHEQLPDGATLHSIKADRIIIERDGELHAIVLDNMSLSTNPSWGKAAKMG